MNGIYRLYEGDYNVCNQVWQDDGSCIVTFFRHDEDTATVLHVEDLHGPKEKVRSEKTLDRSVPQHILTRQLLAKGARALGG